MLSYLPATTQVDSHPFTRLTPDLVLDALETVGLEGDGRLQALNSFENRVYRAHLTQPWRGHAQVVIKFYRPGRWTEAQIREEHRFALALVDEDVPVVAPLTLCEDTLHQHEGFFWALTPYRGGRRPELDDFDTLETLGRLIGRLHRVGAQQGFEVRPALTVQRLGHASREALLSHGWLPPELETPWARISADVLQAVEQHAASLSASDRHVLRLHGDCHPGNLLWSPEGGAHLVDLDDACSGPAIQDLWMLLSGDRHEQTRQFASLLDGYETYLPLDRRELTLIEPLRTLRMLHHDAWIAGRWHDPAFPVAFPWFGSSEHWSARMQALEAQLQAMEAPPMMV